MSVVDTSYERGSCSRLGSKGIERTFQSYACCLSTCAPRGTAYLGTFELSNFNIAVSLFRIDVTCFEREGVAFQRRACLFDVRDFVFVVAYGLQYAKRGSLQR